MPQFIAGFGTRSVGEATEFCDLLNTIQNVPKAVRPAKINELEEFIHEIAPNTGSCTRIRETFVTFSDREEFVKNPDIQLWLMIVRYNIWDATVDLKSRSKVLCENAKGEKIIETFESFIKDIRAIDLSSDEIKRINAQMKDEWKKEWIKKNAWDFDKEELSQLKTPYDD